MRMKPKTVRRLLLAAVVVFLGVSAAVALLGVRQWQRARGAERLRSEGMALVAKGEYFEALGKLGAYLRPGPTDREALLAYARCREQVEEPDGHHLTDAAAWYKRCYEMDPTDTLTGRTLVRIYNQIGYYIEAGDYARRLYPENLPDAGPEHLDLLRAEALASAGLKTFDARLLAILGRAVELDPDDFATNMLYVSALRKAERSGDAVAFAGRLRDNNPDDARTRVLLILARGADEPGGAEALFGALCEALGLDPTTAAPLGPGRRDDHGFAARARDMLDSLGKYTHSLSLLRELSGPQGTDDSRRLFVRRAWQAGQTEEVVALVSARRDAGEPLHAELLVFDALSLRDLGRPGDVVRVRRTLDQRTGDKRAAIWARVLAALDDHDTLRQSQVLYAAAKEWSGEPVLPYLYGQSLARLGRPEEARTAWLRAAQSPLSVGWQGPWIRLSESYLAEGRPEEAVRAALAAFRIEPTRLAATVALLDAQGALIESGAPMSDQPAALLAHTDKAIAQLDTLADRDVARTLAEVLLPRRILLTAKARGKDEARALVLAAILPQSGLGSEAIQRIAGLCTAHGLGLELECLDAAEKLGGPTPASAGTRAMILAWAGRAAEAAAGLRSLVQNAPEEARAPWQIAMARFLDSTQDPGALAYWTTLADQHPLDLTVQRAALSAPAIAGDLALVERLAERVGRLSGSDQGTPTYATRLARARALLQAPPTPRVRDEAVSLLNALRAEAPDRNDSQALLVKAYLLEEPEVGVLPDLNAAVEVLRTTPRAGTDRIVAALQAAELLQRQRDFDGARAELELVARDPAAPAALRERAVALLERQRDIQAALPAMESIVRDAGEHADPASLLRLASLYSAQRRDPDALAVYRRLAARPPDDPEQIARLADGLAGLNDAAAADSVLDRLGSLRIAPAHRQLILAGFAERHRTPEQALRAYELAVSTDARAPLAWSGLVRLHLSRGDLPRAREVLVSALSNVPDDPGIRFLDELLRIAEGGDLDLPALAQAMPTDAGTRSRAQALRAIEQLRAAGTLNDPAALAELLKRFPDEAALHTLAVRLLLQTRPPRIQPAADLARRALASFPASPEVARVAVAAFKAAGLWREMSGAADAWCQLTRAPEADLALAEARLELDDLKSAIQTLRPYVVRVTADPADHMAVAVLSLQVKALIRAGRQQEAFDLAAPLADRSPTVRTRVFLSAAATLVTPQEEARRWIERACPAGADASVDDRVAEAHAWLLAAERFAPSRVELAGRAAALLRPLSEAPDAASPVLVALAWALRCSGDGPGSTSVLLRAVQAHPTSPEALGALAAVLADGTADPAPCVDTLERLIQGASGDSRALRRTLALACEALAARRDAAGDPAGATTKRARAADLYRGLWSADPNDQGVCLGLARVAQGLGDRPTEIAMYEHVLARADTLTPQDAADTKNNLAYALARAGGSRDVLDRARSLVLDALGSVPSPSFYDTLGTVEAAYGDRGAAIAAFRKAASLSPTMYSSKLELAALLALGSQPERAEAATLVREAEAVEGRSQAFARRLAEVRASLGDGPR